jgi:hypothetical protein
MLDKINNQTNISTPAALRLVGIISVVWALLTVLTTTVSYLPDHPDFSMFTTYLSDMSDSGITPGWPPILFNTGTLIAAPMRYLFIALLVLRLTQIGAGRAFSITVLVVGIVSTMGTVLMTAVPFSFAQPIHMLGIAMYFLGVVVLQTVIGIKEWSLKGIVKLLPGLSFLVVIVFFVFAALMMLYEKGAVGRNTPVIWEWLAFFSSVIWLFAHTCLLGKKATKN